MSSSINPQDQTLTNQTSLIQNPNDQLTDLGQQWETMARAWLSTLPEGKIVTPTDVEAWLQTNHASLPDEIKSMSRPDLYQQFSSLQASLASPNEENDVNQNDHSQARFQRTDQWLPVYSWLETLDTEEVVKSNDILQWLSDKPEVKDDLYARHSRYHLMHYIKKCHVKILKRKERKKGLQITDKASTVQNEERKLPALLPCSTVNNISPESDLYQAKRNEAYRKYEILVELEKQLNTLFPKPESVNLVKDS